MIIIATPSGAAIDARFVQCLGDLLYFSQRRGREVRFEGHVSKSCTEGRNRALDIARGCGATHLLCLDADMTFPPYLLEQLLSYDKMIVGCTYLKRAFPHEPVHLGVRGQEGSLTRVARTAAGVLLIDMRVFDRIREFRILPNRGINSDGYQFCADADDYGYPVYVDLALSEKVGHLGDTELRYGTAQIPRHSVSCA